ncbi:hypothetical protein INT45_012917 [Circinella minor]|uniref:UspA domain-containing protein n=1 Tax=Circinella minor TaxID=1195481 RepID=A0A8H7VQ53_9FUNG|nr:hypothetical protein INT45_012917 [Circinella minor]
MASTKPANAEKDNFLALPNEFLPKPRHQPAGTVQSGRLIVVAYDQTRASDALLDKTIRTGLLQPDDDIRLVHILPQQDLISTFTQSTLGAGLESAYDIQPTNTAEHDEQILIEEKEDMLLAVAKVLKNNSFQHVKVEVIQGDRKESLRDYCQSVNPTFMMTGSRGFGKIKRQCYAWIRIRFSGQTLSMSCHDYQGI